MRATPNLAAERYRVRTGPMGSCRADGNNGAFLVPGPDGQQLTVIVSDGMGWDHVSVSTPHRCPTWDEMSHVKDLFFDPEERVMQLHPPRSEYVNNHEYCLHLWRPQEAELPAPPPETVGFRSLNPRAFR